ncbi:hypothetical protein PENTCL1PPCAC_23825, partial [Pristionchus entomophagus]
FDLYDVDAERDWETMERRAAKTPDGVFWSGRWSMGKEGEERNEHIGMRRLQKVMIRDEGREAKTMLVLQIVRTCRRLDLIFTENSYATIQGKGSFLSHRFNRYLMAKDNYNLNNNGRALFRALLTMNSDKVARACKRSHDTVTEDGVRGTITVWDRFENYKGHCELREILGGFQGHA